MLRKSHTYVILNSNSHPQTSMKEYYTYAYLREDGTPYYVGKGKEDRVYKKHRGHTVPSKDRILFLKKNLTEEEAYKHEVYMIAILGRKDIKTGILHNKTDGGSGGDTGYLGSEEHKELMRKRTGDKNSFYGRKHTPEALERISNALKGRTAWNKDKCLPDAQVSAHALYMREWRMKNRHRG